MREYVCLWLGFVCVCLIRVCVCVGVIRVCLCVCGCLIRGYVCVSSGGVLVRIFYKGVYVCVIRVCVCVSVCFIRVCVCVRVCHEGVCVSVIRVSACVIRESCWWMYIFNISLEEYSCDCQFLLILTHVLKLLLIYTNSNKFFLDACIY